MTSKQAVGVNYRSTQGHPRESSPKMHAPRVHHKNGGSFVFRRRTQPIDWRLLAGVDIDRIQDELDFGCLQQGCPKFDTFNTKLLIQQPRHILQESLVNYGSIADGNIQSNAKNCIL